MSIELMRKVTEYLNNRQTLADFAEWLSSINWDKGSLDIEAQGILGRLELILTEVFEGLRPELDFRREISKLVINIIPLESANVWSGSTNVISYEPKLISVG